jgi:hypothetical protein
MQHLCVYLQCIDKRVVVWPPSVQTRATVTTYPIRIRAVTDRVWPAVRRPLIGTVM